MLKRSAELRELEYPEERHLQIDGKREGLSDVPRQA